MSYLLKSFAGLGRLQELDLGLDNDLSELPAEVLAGLSNLQILNLGANYLGELPAEVWANLFAGLRQLTKDLNLGAKQQA